MLSPSTPSAGTPRRPGKRRGADDALCPRPGGLLLRARRFCVWLSPAHWLRLGYGIRFGLPDDRPRRGGRSRIWLQTPPCGVRISVLNTFLVARPNCDMSRLLRTAHAQAKEYVYDSRTGQRLLIPEGARLIGDCESDVGFGQRRVLLARNRLVLPDGRSTVLESQLATDTSGFAALEDKVDYHWGDVLKAALSQPCWVSPASWVPAVTAISSERYVAALRTVSIGQASKSSVARSASVLRWLFVPAILCGCW